MKKQSNLSDPWAALDAIMATDPEPMGPEWFTRSQFQERYKFKSTAGAQRRLDGLEREGLVEKWTGKMAATNRVGFKYRKKVA